MTDKRQQDLKEFLETQQQSLGATQDALLPPIVVSAPAPDYSQQFQQIGNVLRDQLQRIQQPQINLKPVTEAIQRLAPQVNVDLQPVVDAIEQLTPQVNVDLQPIAKAISKLAESILRQASAVEALVKAVAAKPPPTVEVNPAISVAATPVTVTPHITVEGPKTTGRRFYIKHADGTQATVWED